MSPVVAVRRMMSPPATDTRRPVVRNLRFPVAMWDRLRSMAAADRRSINWLVVDLLNEEINRRDGQPSQLPPTT